MPTNKAYNNHDVGLPPRSSSSSTPAKRIIGNSSSDSLHSSHSSISSQQFQMMDISVCVLVLEGLTMESNLPKEQMKIYDTTEPVSSPIILGKVPVTSVISCFKNISGNREIATHVPSLPLIAPVKSIGKKTHKFIVRWPLDYDTMGDALSTFRYKRLMKKEFPAIDRYDEAYSYGYAAEEIELNICLMRGSEMITLGAANLVITGEEMEEITVDLPIDVSKGATKRDRKARSPSPLRRSGSKIFVSSKSSNKVMKAKNFPSDTRRKYKLSDHSMVRLRIKVTPSQSSSSFDEIESHQNENIYRIPHYSHPNFDEEKVIQIKNKQKQAPLRQHRPQQPSRQQRSQNQSRHYIPEQISRKYILEDPSRQQMQRSRSSPRPRASMNHKFNALHEIRQQRGVSVSMTRRDFYHNDSEHWNLPHERNTVSNQRNSSIQNNGVHPMQRESNRNGHISQRFDSRGYQAQSKTNSNEQKILSIPPERRRYSITDETKRTQQSSQKIQSPQTLFDTILTHSVSLITGTQPTEYVDNKQCTQRSSSKKKSSRKSDYSSSSESESDSDSSWDSSYRHGRGRSPHRR